MLEKNLAHQVLRKLLRYGNVEVTFWDNSVRRYAGTQGTDEPVLRVAIKDPGVVRRMLVNASLAIGEAYTNGQLQISEDQLALFFKLVARNQPTVALRQPFRRHRNHKEAQQSYIEAHYSVDPDSGYYRLFLDPTCTYSCAYFKSRGDGLEQAQHQKIDHVLRKLRLEPGMRLLDIGCGWGYLAVAAAKQYNARVLGITLSTAQLAGARALAEREGVSHLVRFELMNYQDLPASEPFDRIVSVGMFEHVGRGNRDQYFSKVAELLVDGGVSLLHTITQRQSRPVDAWVDKYIFPGGHLPTVSEIEDGLEKHGLWSIDRENLWEHYAETLRMWRDSHRKNRAQIVEMFDPAFYRMRDFWLAGSEGGFRYGQLGLAQVVFTKGKPGDSKWPLTRAYLY